MLKRLAICTLDQTEILYQAVLCIMYYFESGIEDLKSPEPEINLT
ncbi:hypothetical protein CI610_03266 [invertebrate metagenome]|uniref:Uncharacterized protein n=1 Tax=invertebrate metagenome TaxID=1711999 RepID=A0A2H9T3K1_9ZZZZ